jgi:NAD(P)-dependent dehydrogenase (short-subunit alcohol dehydrogenase family)
LARLHGADSTSSLACGATATPSVFARGDRARNARYHRSSAHDTVAARLVRDRRRLRALINNAGTAINAPVELLPIDEWRRQFEVNLFGQVALTRALLPRLIADAGRVVNVSSIGGRVAGPTFGAYAASKFALEAMSALRREVAGLGVDVVVIEPGAVATPIWEKGVAMSDQLVLRANEERAVRYRDLINAMRKQAQDVGRGGTDPREVARVIVKASERRGRGPVTRSGGTPG